MTATRTEPRTTTIDLPASATRDVTLLVLLADTPIPPVVEQFGTYHDIFAGLWRRAVRLAASEDGQEPAKEGSGHKLIIESYQATDRHLPSEERVKEADGMLITGSASSAYDDDPWIVDLVSFLQRLPSLNASLKLIGICFGHQIIARANGGVCERSAKGWEIGTRRIELTQRGKQLFEGRERINIHQMHRDHVPSVPKGFELLGSTSDCDVHGFVRFVDESAPHTAENIAVVTLQGHPEFNSTIVNEVIDMREGKGVISHELAEESREYAGQHDDGDWIGRVLLRMFGV
ncbi:hypothetical protein JCM10449v2_006922 [Rhodotorula kratochvilovae]